MIVAPKCDDFVYLRPDGAEAWVRLRVGLDLPDLVSRINVPRSARGVTIRRTPSKEISVRRSSDRRRYRRHLTEPRNVAAGSHNPADDDQAWGTGFESLEFGYRAHRD